MDIPALTEFEEELIEYFSPLALSELVFPDHGKPYTKPCPIPMLEGFCGDRNITVEELEGMVSARVLKVCEHKQHNILVHNGLGKAYDSALTGLVLKNKHSYSEKVESTQRKQFVLSTEDKKLLERMGIARLGDGGKIIDVSDSVRVS